MKKQKRFAKINLDHLNATIFCVLVCLLLCFVSTKAQTSIQNQKNQAKTIALTNVTVIDMASSKPRAGMTVVLSDGRIAVLGRSNKIKIPNGAQVIDASGKYLIPGLIDMHVHLGDNEKLLTLYIVNGVTGVRSMADSPKIIKLFRQQISGDKLLGPRILITAGRLIDGPNPVWKDFLTATTADEGKKAVIKAKEEGSEFIKVYEMLSREAFFGIADEARRRKISFAGHLPITVSAGEASDSGQKSIEHLLGIQLACSLQENQLRERAIKSSSVFFGYRRSDNESYSSFNKVKADELFKRFVKNGTWQTPTFTINRAFLFIDDPEFVNDSRLKYLPPETQNFWKSFLRPSASQFISKQKERAENLLQHQLDLVKSMHKAGVQILAGTDAPNFYAFPGFSLHDELELLVKSGLSPFEALQASTSGAAKFLNQTHNFGTIEKDKIADLVLLDANPLENISNTKRINSVFAGGKYFSRRILDEMLDELEQKKSE